MKVSDYIVSFLIEQKITDAFGYPGGMVTHLMDSFERYRDRISAHVTYHEQGAAFAACGYAQVTGRPGFAYATSGPGATNLITGIANAYFDSIPTIFLTGQVNTGELKGAYQVRQLGFQEMDVLSLVRSITKYSAQVTCGEDIRQQLEAAMYWSMQGRPGPVLLDIPMNVLRSEIEPEQMEPFAPPLVVHTLHPRDAVACIYAHLSRAKRPCVLLGGGIHSAGVERAVEEWALRLQVPVVCSLPGVDLLPNYAHNYGLIGAYGVREANFIAAKSDLILCLGSRLDIRQTGADPVQFAPHAALVRVDVDAGELARSVHADETALQLDLRDLLPALARADWSGVPVPTDWLETCDSIRDRLTGYDSRLPNELVTALSTRIASNWVITTDVGQNQIWVAQSFAKKGQRILFSSGHGAMGYALPAAIGACYGSGGKCVAFTGDGGLQMNLQELQVLAREKLPVKVVLLNNQSLGMIRHFQEMYFDRIYTQTTAQYGYNTPDFRVLCSAYGIPYHSLTCVEEVADAASLFEQDGPGFIEVLLPDTTYVFPKLEFGKPNQDQEPALPRELYDRINNI